MRQFCWAQHGLEEQQAAAFAGVWQESHSAMIQEKPAARVAQVSRAGHLHVRAAMVFIGLHNELHKTAT